MEVEKLVGVEEESPKTERTIYELFKWSLILKGVISVGEVIVGFILLFIPVSFVLQLIEQAEHMVPAHGVQGALMSRVLDEFTNFSHATLLFVSAYLITRGLVKLFLVWALLKDKLWAYPLSVGILGLLVMYQLYEIYLNGSLFVIGITIFDFIVIYLIIREYRILKRHQLGL